MTKTITRLAGVSMSLAIGAAVSFYVGSRYAAVSVAETPDNILSQQFGGDPGDGWMLFGGFLLIVALAVAGACAMLWAQDRKQ